LNGPHYTDKPSYRPRKTSSDNSGKFRHENGTLEGEQVRRINRRGLSPWRIFAMKYQIDARNPYPPSLLPARSPVSDNPFREFAAAEKKKREKKINK